MPSFLHLRIPDTDSRAPLYPGEIAHLAPHSSHQDSQVDVADVHQISSRLFMAVGEQSYITRRNPLSSNELTISLKFSILKRYALGQHDALSEKSPIGELLKLRIRIQPKKVHEKWHF